ncbi:MAG: UPF0179 family protein [Candidatus Methanoplasma sp.]|jgi:uncharacterized protein (UPF0179 family)|nr:UPF0179 family protein [Candidatus Methanoplasma sp.]
MAITLVSVAQARAGRRFVYLGPQPECEGCRLRRACLNLEEGSTYEIVGVRPVSHECALGEGASAVAEVERVPSESSVPKRSAIEGSVITYKGIRCGRPGCPSYRVCHPHGASDGDKRSIVETLGDMDCPAGEKLVLARVL